MVFVGWIVLRRTQDPPRWAVHPLALFVLIALQAVFDIWHYIAFGSAS
jgi:hypothetical protein